jgi:DNA sulfur modification protein DndB
MPVSQLLELVPSPVLAEDPKRTAEDPVLAAYAEVRNQVQRAMEGAKERNASSYGKYLVEWLLGQKPGVVPPITLYSPQRLSLVSFDGMPAVVIPFGAKFPAIDGETQRVGWERAAREIGMAALNRRVAITLHHGKTLEEARQAFYDLNVLEVKPSAAVAISMDTQDPATHVTRAIIEASPLLHGRVNMRRRQLRKRDPELVTISALRTGVVTTLLGRPGLQYGTRPVTLPSDIDMTAVQKAAVAAWTAIVDEFEDEIASREDFLITAPAILAGIGCVAHHAMPRPPRGEEFDSWTVEEVVDRLVAVRWERESTVWNGIVGKMTPKGNLSISGPKEVGHAVADALEDPESAAGRQLRGLDAAAATALEPSAAIGVDLQAAVKGILERAASPMHVADIRSALAKAGVPIPGKGTDANIIVHLRRAPDTFDRRGRGLYGLKDWKARKVRS